jgi:hypothetical protein
MQVSVTDFGALASAAQRDGWASGSGDIDSIREHAASLGWVEVPTRRGDAPVSVLRPAETNAAHPRSLATTPSDTGAGLRGRFWLQGAPEGEAVLGYLFLKPGANPLLELDGALTPLMRETSRRQLPDGRAARTSSPVPWQELAGQSLTVHGTLDETGEPVTLPSAFTAPSKPSSSN